MRISLNDKAPDFELPNEEGGIVELADFHGSWVLLYFYPKDGTRGCTTEAKAFRDNHDAFVARDVIILGVSPDSAEEHLAFKEEHGLPFILLADEEKEVCDLYGVVNPEGGIERDSFLINDEGIVVKIYRSVDPEVHAKRVLRDIEKLRA